MLKVSLCEKVTNDVFLLNITKTKLLKIIISVVLIFNELYVKIMQSALVWYSVFKFTKKSYSNNQ